MFEATVIHMRNPVYLHRDRDVMPYDAPKKIRQIIHDCGLVNDDGTWNGPFVVSSTKKLGNEEGAYLLQDEWDRELEDKEVLLLQAVPMGKGGSRIILLIAIAVLAAYTGGAAAGAAGGVATTGGAIAGAAASAAVTIAGTYLINAVLPPPKPKTGNQQTSPNYGLSANGNLARLGEAVPVQYGRFKVFPDYAAQPYTETRGSDTYLYQLFLITQGELDIEAIRIGDTDIAKYAEVQYEVTTPGNRVTLFPDNVITSDAVQGVVLLAPEEANTSAPDYSPYSGPFIIGVPGQTYTRIGIDISYPQGMFRVNEDGKTRGQYVNWLVEVQQVDDNGNPIGGWITHHSVNGTLLYYGPETFSYYLTVPEGRYQVRASKGDSGPTDRTRVYTVMWMGARAYLPNFQTYGDATLLAVVMRATNNLNANTQRQINVIGTRKVPVYDGANWSAPVANRNPAWALADLFRNTTYGAGWDDNRLILSKFKQLADVWTTRGDCFDGVFDTKTTVWEAAKAICRVGRATPIYYAGVIDVIRDQAKSVATLMIHPNNIVAGSLSIKYLFPTVDTPDYVTATYIDPVTWKQAPVDCALDDSPKLLAKTIDFFGITQHDQAWKEGIYMAACNRDQRRIISVTMELAGLIPQYGDLVKLTHDVAAWGQFGVVTSIDPETAIAELTEPVQFSAAAATHAIAFQKRDGSAAGPYTCVEVDGNQFQVRITGLTATQLGQIYVSNGNGEVPTSFAFGPNAAQALDCVVLTGKPNAEGRVALTLTNYSASVHLAETNTGIPTPSSPSGLLDPDLAPSVGGVGVSEPQGGGDGGTVYLSVAPVPGAVAYEFEISYDGGITWLAVGISPVPHINAVIPPGTWIVRARAYGRSAQPGGWTDSPITVVGEPWPLGALASFTGTGFVFGLTLNWAFPSGLDSIDAGATEIRYGLTGVFNDSLFLVRLAYPTNSYTMSGLPPGQTYVFWARMVSKTTGAPGPWSPSIAVQSSSDASEILAYIAGKLSEEELTEDLVAKIDLIPDLDTRLDAAEAALGELSGDFDSIQGIITRFSPVMVGSTTDYIGATTGRVGVYSEISARQEADGIVGKKVDSVIAIADSALGVANAASAAVITEATARASADTALATNITTTQAQVGNLNAAVVTNATAVADLSGQVSAAYSVKVQIDPGTGKYITAGYTIGVNNSGGIAQSQFIIQADLLALISSAGGTITSPFTILAGIAYLNSAFIQDGTITNGKIANVLQSTAVDSTGNPIWKLDKVNGLTIRGSDASGRVENDGAGARVYNAAGQLLMRWGRW